MITVTCKINVHTVKRQYYSIIINKTSVPQSAEYSPPEDGEEESQEEDDQDPNPGT